VGSQLARFAFGLCRALRARRRRHLGRLEGALGSIDFGLELLQRILGGDPSELRHRRVRLGTLSVAPCRREIGLQVRLEHA